MIEDKISAIQSTCGPLVGTTIERYETAEILHDDGTWSDWPDLPIRIHCSGGTLIAVSWSQFDDLWLSNDTSLPFAAEDARTRWNTNNLPQINSALGRTIRRVLLGRGEMTIESREIEIWTRLVFDLGDRWLEIFNALDENGYQLYEAKPAGQFRECA